MIDNDFSSIREKIVVIVTTLIVYFFDGMASCAVAYSHMFMRCESTKIVDWLSLPIEWVDNIYAG
mgnify:CR=1 FL=1